MSVSVGFSAVGAVYQVFGATVFPVVVFCAERTFLLLLTKPGSMSESKAFDASSYSDEFFHSARAPLELYFLKGK